MTDSTATTEATAKNFASAVIEKSRETLVLVDFWADWCAPCRMLMPVLAALATEFSEKIQLVKVNTDKESQLATEYGVRSLPTVKLFKAGQVVDEFMGVLPERAVRELIERYLDRPADHQIRIAVELSATGQHDEAIKLLAAALAEDPKYDKTRLALAEEQIEVGSLADARQTLNEVSDLVRFDAPFKILIARLELAEIANSDVDRATLEKRISSNPDDLASREQLGAICFAAGENDAAMEQWLEIVRRGQGDIKDNGRENLIRSFEVLGSQDQDVTRYRRLLAQALN
jgi:putative thioredoxin